VAFSSSHFLLSSSAAAAAGEEGWDIWADESCLFLFAVAFFCFSRLDSPQGF
jgi:hypothetical protein